ncbi:MAG: type II toxin-antitoxin system VapC family toxin [Candidatus Dormibacteraceae bacterium]
MTVCLDSWAVLAWLDGESPAYQRVEILLGQRPIISWVNMVEIYYRLYREHGQQRADQVLEELRGVFEVELPGISTMIETARLKAILPIALGDCFAIATASAHELPLLTGDPEILDRDNVPCQTEDLRKT